MSINNVLIYSRRRNYNRLKNFVSELLRNESNVKIELWSDENLPNKEVIKFSEYLYSNLNNEKKLSFFISELEINESIKRCRYLRVIKYDLAVKLLTSAVYSWKSILEKKQYDLIFSLPVDSYINDSLYIVAKKLKVPFLTSISSLYSNRVRFTERGNIFGKIQIGNLDNNKINEMIENLSSNNFKPDFLCHINESTLYKRYIVDAIKLPVFFLYRLLFRDPYSFSFAEWKYYKFRTVSSFKRVKLIRKIEKKALKVLPEKYIYIPLQFYPEAVTDYWIKEVSMINFHENVLKIVEYLKKYNIKIITKEHPAAIAKRDELFLSKLYNMPNVDFVSTYYPNSNIIENAFMVIGYGSTSILEAMIKEKHILFMGTPYYGSCSAEVLTNLSESEFDEKYNKAKEFNVKFECVRKVLINIFLCSGEGSQGDFNLIGEKTSLSTNPVVGDSLIEHFYKSIEDINVE